ncbi:type II toxin-antitoxin system VapC family toxin [Flexivirga caeni]|uniref:type II toxin-antitoxin system VapC family toxin n=1 Tax=Flexivirga caeni TaxID=2294115 RepID=UPI0015E8794D|nr:type II toxin-antitoxin system VapC family toxin [Flexivirga caeni]
MVTSLSCLDASAAMKLLVEEAESDALVRELTGSGRTLVASWLLHIELHCAAGRNPQVIEGAALATVLDVVNLDVTRGDLLSAGTHAPLRSHDAIHLAVGLRLGASEMITYDAGLSAAATAAGLAVIAGLAAATRGTHCPVSHHESRGPRCGHGERPGMVVGPCWPASSTRFGSSLNGALLVPFRTTGR